MKKRLICWLLFLGGITYLLSLSSTVWAQNYSVLDNRAKMAPLAEADSKAQLVSYLTKDLQTDMQKARVLAAYIAYQFQRNGYEQRQLDKASQQRRPAPQPLSNDFLKTRIGTSFDFAKLYQELCTLAGLQAVTIKGYAGKNVRADQTDNKKLHALESGLKQLTNMPNYALQRYQAAWNAVKIDGQWVLIDTYWMISGNQSEAKDIENPRKMSRFLAQRERRTPSLSELTGSKQLDNDYFNAKPRFLIKTHYPLNNQWQLLPIPVTWGNFISN